MLGSSSGKGSNAVEADDEDSEAFSGSVLLSFSGSGVEEGMFCFGTSLV